jgi:hypothetical protein
MPRLVKYTTSGFVDNVPDQALAVIEHASLFYICEQNFKGMNKYVVLLKDFLLRKNNLYI